MNVMIVVASPAAAMAASKRQSRPPPDPRTPGNRFRQLVPVSMVLVTLQARHRPLIWHGSVIDAATPRPGLRRYSR
jgi:hypothetical protein